MGSIGTTNVRAEVTQYEHNFKRKTNDSESKK
jgi:hypothetical protein